jgi:hypothetical protein
MRAAASPGCDSVGRETRDGMCRPFRTSRASDCLTVQPLLGALPPIAPDLDTWNEERALPLLLQVYCARGSRLIGANSSATRWPPDPASNYLVSVSQVRNACINLACRLTRIILNQTICMERRGERDASFCGGFEVEPCDRRTGGHPGRAGTDPGARHSDHRCTTSPEGFGNLIRFELTR